MRRSLRHRIEIVTRQGVRAPTAKLRRGVRSVLNRHSKGPACVCVLLTDDEEIRRMNREYRGVDGATDVLSFPAPATAIAGAAPCLVGDVAIGVPFAARQASARGVDLEEEVAMLGIHGTLHLLGFQDEDPVSRKRMAEEMLLAARDAEIALQGDWKSLGHEPFFSEVPA